MRYHEVVAKGIAETLASLTGWQKNGQHNKPLLKKASRFCLILYLYLS
jgi:hypothetical protein